MAEINPNKMVVLKSVKVAIVLTKSERLSDSGETTKQNQNTAISCLQGRQLR